MRNEARFETLGDAERFLDQEQSATAIIRCHDGRSFYYTVAHGPTDRELREAARAKMTPEARSADIRRRLQEIEDVARAQKSAEKMQQCTAEAVLAVAAERAAAAGLQGEAARMYQLGFAGWSAKIVQPRRSADGSQYYVGKAARHKDDGRDIRATAARLYYAAGTAA